MKKPCPLNQTFHRIYLSLSSAECDGFSESVTQNIPQNFEPSSSVRSRICSGFCCCCLLHCIAISDAQQSSVAARRGSSRVDSARGSVTSSVAPRFARPPSVQRPRARPQQQSFQPGQTAENEDQKSTQKTETMRTSFRGCIRETDQGQRPCDEDQACGSSFGRHRKSRSRWLRAAFKRRVRHEGDAVGAISDAEKRMVALKSQEACMPQHRQMRHQKR